MDSPVDGSRSDSLNWLGRMGQKLIHASEGKGCWSVLVRVLASFTVFFTGLYLLSFWALILSLRFVGEQNITTAFLLFVPPSIWWLPAIPLAVAGLFFHRKSLLAVLLSMVVFGHQFLDWRWGGGGTSQAEPGRQLRVMTNNHGQHGNHSLRAFKNQQQPDVIVLQEAYGKAEAYARVPEFAEFAFHQREGEHLILSRYPIQEVKMLPSLTGKNSKAARFVIDWNGRQIAIYSIHLQTAREVLESQKRGSFLYGVLGLPGTPFVERRRQMQVFWDDQLADVEIVLKHAGADALPVILAGDFNAPHLGHIHRLITRQFKDAHEAAGQGAGFTFPGATRNPLSAGGPWLRIDYVFYGRDWKAVQCVTEADRPSQHRALTAVLEFSPPAP